MKREKFKCVLCKGAMAHPWLMDCPDHYLRRGCSVDYVECESCKLIQQCPMPEDASALYVDYPVHLHQSALHRFARRIFHRQIYYRPKIVKHEGVLLDYGCGNGTFLREIESWFGEVCGFEPDLARSIALTERIDMPVYSSTEVLCRERRGMVDVITAHFVLEHVDDIRLALATFSSLLKPGGVCHIAVPNIRSWEARFFKRYWHGLDAPRHLAFPEPVHFKELAAEFGFLAPQVTHGAFPNALAGSLSSFLSGHFRATLMIGFLLPSWLVAIAAPQGTWIVRMTRMK